MQRRGRESESCELKVPRDRSIFRPRAYPACIKAPPSLIPLCTETGQRNPREDLP